MAPRKRLHELAPEIPAKTRLPDPPKKREFVLGKQFASGGFGRIYTCTESGKATQLCCKIEPQGNGPLFAEINVFHRILKQDQLQEFCKKNKLSTSPLPFLICTGIFEYQALKMRFLIMPKYSVSLESLREKAKIFDVRTCIVVAERVLYAYEYLHSKNYTHADLKAANVLLESPTDYSSAVLVDFGLARMSAGNDEKPDKKRAHNGTAIFTSLDAHIGRQPSYRADLEILVYNLLLWLHGDLPWKRFEDTPEKVYDEKQKFASKFTENIAKLVKSSSSKALGELYKISQNSSYKSHLDFKQLRTIMSAWKMATPSTPSKTSKRLSPSSESAVSSKRSASGRSRSRKPLNDNDEGDQENLLPGRTPVSPTQATPSTSTSERLTRARARALNVPDIALPKQSAKKVATSGVPREVAACAEKLREQVPGVLNFGYNRRRTLVINEIAERNRRRLDGDDDDDD